MTIQTCKSCEDYRRAEKPLKGFNGYTGVCYERTPPYNKVREDMYCKDHSGTNPNIVLSTN